MRRVLGCDLHIAARYLLRFDGNQRKQNAECLLAKAGFADRYRRRFGRAHPVCGNGTVTGAVGAIALPPERHIDDPDYLDCLKTVLDALSLVDGGPPQVKLLRPDTATQGSHHDEK